MNYTKKAVIHVRHLGIYDVRRSVVQIKLISSLNFGVASINCLLVRRINEVRKIAQVLVIDQESKRLSGQ